MTLHDFLELSHLAMNYNPKLLDRYPVEDYPEMPFPAITNFCFPQGVKLTTTHYPPTVFHFVMTADSGVRTYGICLNFFEKKWMRNNICTTVVGFCWLLHCTMPNRSWPGPNWGAFCPRGPPPSRPTKWEHSQSICVTCWALIWPRRPRWRRANVFD